MLPVKYNERKKFLAKDEDAYKIFESIVKARIPGMFTGSILLNYFLRLPNLPLYRYVGDIDFTTDISLHDSYVIKETIDKALFDNGYFHRTELFRTLNSGQEVRLTSLWVYDLQIDESEGLKFEKEPLCPIDVKPAGSDYAVQYELDTGYKFYGCSFAKTVADKIYSLSTKNVFARIKDFYDLYLYSLVPGWSTQIIAGILESDGRELQEFSVVQGRFRGMKSSYRYVPFYKQMHSFNTMHRKIIPFLQPFINGKYLQRDLYWDGAFWVPKSKYSGPLMKARENAF